MMADSDDQIFHPKLEITSDAWYENLILNEFEIGYGLQHENIVQIFDLLQNENGQWCLVMEYVQEKNPNDKITVSQLSQKCVDEIFVQLIHGISYLHSKGIAHRDINPRNCKTSYTVYL